MRLLLPFGVIVLGCLLLSAGVAMISRPAALMTAGVLAIAIGVLLIDDGRRPKK